MWQRCLTVGSVVLLQLEDRPGFISATSGLVPQVRAEQLVEGVDYPTEVFDCRFEITQKCQYVEKGKYLQELSKLGLTAEDADADTVQEGQQPAAPDAAKPQLATGQKGKLARSRSMAVQQQARATRFANLQNERAREKLLALHDSCDRELQSNEEEFSRMVAEPVLYGQVVQLR